MSVKFKVEGFREMEKALARLPRGTAKGVTRRVVKKVLEPVRDTADSYSGAFNVAITSRLSPRQSGLARGDRGPSLVSMYVGPVTQDGSHAPHAHLIEFGTAPRFHKSGKYVGAVSPDPFMRPAWDMHKGQMLEELGRLMWVEIEKTVARAAAKAAREAAR
ncbi:hypothetical protein [Jannaschia formosa]|uniref:hypothetical protein n=1 Tax=Jannaschia formosa TaxID=2259592 RepID=UPI000E1B753C|nr:hypothetical protein [Jannaschia formosa]TFL16429.1 hypothetical protein DR046_20120 [Jannaschia formosa]